jgi:hypothetical protein
MSQQNPNPEERARIVADVTKHLIPLEKQDELSVLKEKRNAVAVKIQGLMKPIIDASIMMPPKSPLYAHSDSGRANLILQALRLYIDGLKEFNQDELLWLLAFEYANRAIEHQL